MAKLANKTEESKTTSAYLSKPEPRPKKSAKALLFDRLINDNLNETKEHSKKIVLNQAQVIDSIVSEVVRLLNSRLSATAKIYSQYKDQDYGLGLPWMYGIPDFASLDLNDRTQWKKIAEIFKNAIQYFEPRIQNVNVSFDHFDGQNQRLYVSVLGQVIMKEFQQPVAFGVEINTIG